MYIKCRVSWDVYSLVNIGWYPWNVNKEVSHTYELPH